MGRPRHKPACHSCGIPISIMSVFATGTGQGRIRVPVGDVFSFTFTTDDTNTTYTYVGVLNPRLLITGINLKIQGDKLRIQYPGTSALEGAQAFSGTIKGSSITVTIGDTTVQGTFP